MKGYKKNSSEKIQKKYGCCIQRFMLIELGISIVLYHSMCYNLLYLVMVYSIMLIVGYHQWILLYIAMVVALDVFDVGEWYLFLCLMALYVWGLAFMEKCTLWRCCIGSVIVMLIVLVSAVLIHQSVLEIQAYINLYSSVLKNELVVGFPFNSYHKVIPWSIGEGVVSGLDQVSWGKIIVISDPKLKAMEQHFAMSYMNEIIHVTKGQSFDSFVLKLLPNQEVFNLNKPVCSPCVVHFKDYKVSKLWTLTEYRQYMDHLQMTKPTRLVPYDQYLVKTHLKPNIEVIMKPSIPDEFYLYYRKINYNMNVVHKMYLESNQHKPGCDLKFYNWVMCLGIHDLGKIHGELTHDRVSLLVEEINNVEIISTQAYRIFDYHKLIIENSFTKYSVHK